MAQGQLDLDRELSTRVIYCDDNRVRLASLPSESMDLIYLDPPFFSNRFYEVIWGDEAEIRSFEDRWEGGIQVYVNWMWDRVQEMHRLLKPSGALFLHSDWHAGHYLKVMLDQIFGQAHFRNEIIWHYRFRMMQNKRVLNRKHDTIFFYAKSEKHRIKMPVEPWTREEIIRVRKQAIYKDDDGREWIWMPGGKGHSKNKPKYLDDIIKEGKALDDVWGIPIVSSSAKERLHYPTQKPESLLERIIEMSSPEGGIVLDPFAGCGTTLVAAERLGRKWVGIDISPTAVNLMKRRMDKIGAAGIRLVNLPTTEAQLRTLKHFEFQNWVIQRFNGTYGPRGGDMGIDGRSFFYHYPIQVKQFEHVGRDEIDKFETAVERDGATAGYVVGFSFTKGAHEEAARVKARKGLTIKLVTVSDLLQAVPELAVAEVGQLIDLPLPPPRPPTALPSVEELVVSDRTA